MAPTDLTLSIFPNDMLRYLSLAAAIIFALVLLTIWWFRRANHTTKAVILWIDSSGSVREDKAISAALEGLTQLLVQAKAEKIVYLVSIKTFSHVMGDLDVSLKIGPRSVINPFTLVPQLREIIRSNSGGTDMALIYDNTPEDTAGIVVSDMEFVFKPETADEAASRTDIRYIRFDDSSDLFADWNNSSIKIELSQELFVRELGHDGKLA